MQSIIECYRKVSKECFKFIRSQETPKEKFKNKEKMIKSFLIPISFWINNRTKKSKPYLIGLAGGQGTGKTTISSILKIILTKYFKLNVFKISIDDLYKSRRDRIKLSQRIHPLLMTRGVPGTHDIHFIFNLLKKTKSKRFNHQRVPKFNKAIDDRLKRKSCI
jgi:Predicted kinase